MKRHEDDNFGQVWAVLIAITFIAWVFYLTYSGITANG